MRSPDWPELVRHHGPLVWRTAYRLLSHDADAADCFQRAFLSAVELAASEPIRSWPATLTRLATARALDQLRARYRAAGRVEALNGEPPGSSADPFECAAAGELADALRHALAAIDPAQAQVFCLTCLEGFSNTDAADQLGISANHAGVLLHRARVALRDKLRAFDPQPEGRHD
jgi:RNA polymerase sigma-70 factor (ECF subfamily)